ncbi:thiamine pyrophosphate-dependent enzyme [Acanthopleuribacter pedis]|uniref:Thiamine pyrophosphate-dependent dehydrogenase E1 component subunit alpha n=1 Tax=Acanthopleuribacter pedis TaxID=442870 RepID=A0A8J7U1X7_9BACT|nr:thiamine pyrophosphate-dependent dehydrogenase E1 component subunit alpha [Acanthopleuribacter pedis]
MSQEQTEQFFRKLSFIRLFESHLLEQFSWGKLSGTTHTCIGQEANAVGITASMGRGDVVFSNHRCHGHYLAFTDDAFGLLAEIMGREEGVCRGWGGSQHLCRDGFYSNGIQGGIVANAVGAALAEKHAETGAVTTVFLGDGTLGEGLVYESMNLAALWSLPVLFVIEHNGYAQSTPTRLQLAGELEARPRAFGIPTLSLASNDADAVHAAVAPLFEQIRAGEGPRCFVSHTYRLGPHSKGDDHRDPAEIEARRTFDPIRLYRTKLPETRATEIEQANQNRLAEIVNRLAESEGS